ncbi:MAG: N-acetyltransferase [Deltaproteobacteria bacterium]|nr:N-acetyltransferase [Deltaproteobacteria bacterium]
MTIDVTQVETARDRADFLRLPHILYRSDPHWIAPLTMERRDFINPRKNPFFTYGEAALFVARRGREVVGRVSAHVNSEHDKLYKDDMGFFGFFEAADDPDVARALIARAEAWLSAKGRKAMRGPISFTMNDEVGVLIDGFDTPPFVLMAHSLPYYPKLLEACGLAKAKDLYAWRYISAEKPAEKAVAIAELARKTEGLVLRDVDMKNFLRDLRIILDIFNDVWRLNWGFVPLTEAEIQKTAKDLKMILEPRLAIIAEWKGEPIAISIAIPNINEALAGLDGKLFPFGLLRLLWRIKVRGLKSSRLALLGIKRSYRGQGFGGRGLAPLLYTEMHLRSQKLGHWGGELGWTLEDNDRINVGIEFMGGKVYKKYRVFQKAI